MSIWFLGGGWIMWFLALVGLLTILAAAGFARFPEVRKLPRIEALSRAVAWATVTGLCADLAAVGTRVPANPAWAHSPDLPLIVMTGIAESMSPVTFGGAILSVVALLVAAGHRRGGLRATPGT
jgi:hypothetical protein